MLTNHTHSSCPPTAISQEILKLVPCQLKNASSFFWKCYQAEYQVAWQAHNQNQTQRDTSKQIIKLTNVHQIRKLKSLYKNLMHPD